jgi:hypothetical protein
MKKLLLISLLAISALAACGKDVSFDTLETARKQAKENAEFNGRKWRAETKIFADSNMISRGDSTQAPECPQGDGWASIDIVSANGLVQSKLKCSTVSDSVGCLEDKDFKTKSYANEDGHCAPVTKVPHPLPKIAK